MFGHSDYPPTDAPRGGHHGRHQGHRCRSFGPGPRGGYPFGAGFGPGPGGGGPRGRGRGRKARRGDFRTAALLLLGEEPRNGYQLMQEVEERSGGVWRPSPGSVYPALAQLEDEGLIRSEEVDGRKLFNLTDAGRAHLDERGSDRPAPWDEMSEDLSSGAHELGRLMREVAGAFVQVVHVLRAEKEAVAEAALEIGKRIVGRIRLS